MPQPLPMANKKKKSKPASTKKAKKPAAKKPAKAAKPKAAAKKKIVAKPAKKVVAKPVKKAAPPKKEAAPKKEATPKALPVEKLKGKAAKAVVVPPPEPPPEEQILTDAEGRRFCRVKDCDQIAVVDAYCRYHYLLFWKKIQVRKKILSEGRLERYIEELTARYPDKFLDMLRKDLRSEKEFLAAIQELEIDESAVDNEFEEESQSYADEIRGMSETAPTREEEEF